MATRTLTRRMVVRTAALATTVLAAPFVRSTRAAAAVVPKGKMVLAWHTNIAARWLDPQQHDGTASGDNFLMALHDASNKNFREVRYDQPAPLTFPVPSRIGKSRNGAWKWKRTVWSSTTSTPWVFSCSTSPQAPR